MKETVAKTEAKTTEISGLTVLEAKGYPQIFEYVFVPFSMVPIISGRSAAS